jgi:hypothetical protein
MLASERPAPRCKACTRAAFNHYFARALAAFERHVPEWSRTLEQQAAE